MNLKIKWKLALAICGLGVWTAASVRGDAPPAEATAQPASQVSGQDAAQTPAAQPAAEPAPLIEPGHTLPSDRRELSFETPGIIMECNLHEGQYVKAGELLAKQDDRQDMAELSALTRDAESDVDLKEAKLTLAAKEEAYARMKKLQEEQTGNDEELEKAKLERDIAEQEIAKAQAELDEKKDKAQKQRIHVDLMHLVSPIDGIVEKVDAKVGEMTTMDRSKPCYVVVKNDPLWVECYLPVAVSQRLSIGQKLGVSHDDGHTWEEASIILLAPVADAGSGTQMIRLELPNPHHRDSGMQVQVQLPAYLSQLANAAPGGR